MGIEGNNRIKYLVGGGVLLGILVGVAVARATSGTPGGGTKTSLAFAGALTDANGIPLPGMHTLAFTFHNGTQQCVSTVSNVTAQAPSGAFQIEVPIDTCPTFFDGADVTVDILVDGTNQVVTGQPVDPVAYAHYADKAAQAIRPSNTTCAAGTVLTTGDAGFACVPLPAPPSYPTCTAGQVLTSNGTTLSCVTVSSSAAAVYVGSTPGTTNGRIVHTGADPGLASAAAFCNDAFPGAHMCTEQDIYHSVATGVINSGTGVIPKAWVYFPNWQSPAGATTVDPTAGLADNCSGYTYPTADTHTVGTAFTWDKWAYNSNWVPKFYGGSADAACFNSFPIACCK